MQPDSQQTTPRHLGNTHLGFYQRIGDETMTSNYPAGYNHDDWWDDETTEQRRLRFRREAAEAAADDADLGPTDNEDWRRDEP